MLRRIMFVSVFGVGVCCLAENGHAQETKSVRWSHEYIISVNADMLADFIFPGCSALTASPRFDGVGVVLQFVKVGLVQPHALCQLASGRYATQLRLESASGVVALAGAAAHQTGHPIH